MGINDALAPAGVAVGELEEIGVNERAQAGSVVSLHHGINAAGVEKRIEFLDARQAPVVKAAELGGVEFGRLRLGLGEGQFVAPGQHTVAIGVGAALPGQAGDVVVNRQTAGAQGIAGRVGLELRVLAVERLAGFGRGNFALVVVAPVLCGGNEGVGLVGAQADGCRSQGQQDREKSHDFFHAHNLRDRTLREH